MGKKISDDEISKVKELTSETEKFAVELGAIKLQKIALNDRKNIVIENVEKLNTQRLAVFRELENKYGSGQLNVDTWEVQ